MDEKWMRRKCAGSQRWIAEHTHWSRRRLAGELCVLWDWRDGSGRAKDLAALSFLLKMEERGWIALPPFQGPDAMKHLTVPVSFTIVSALRMGIKLTRNFCIIAHIDHGKTTLSDRLLQMTGTIADREAQDQHLDSMDLERERGITIKMHPVAMRYKAKDGHTYKLNLLDTPGHVDFAYEVSRSLAACEGALVIVDAAQGVEAQTVANVHLANKQGLTIVPVINKIDLPNSDIPTVKKQLEEILQIPADEAILASAKAGIGIEDILEAVIARIPPPKKWDDDKVRALVFRFDVRRVSRRGDLRPHDERRAASRRRRENDEQQPALRSEGGRRFHPEDATGREAASGRHRLCHRQHQSLRGNQNRRHAHRHASPGDRGAARVPGRAADGFQRRLSDQHRRLRAPQSRDGQAPAQRLRLSSTRPKSSVALGFGFRCGFLGLLHMEIILERLRREYDMDIIATYPSVIYEVEKTNGEVLHVDNPEFLPDPSVIQEIREPIVKCYIMVPNEYISPLMQLIMDKRGIARPHRVARHAARHAHLHAAAQRNPRRFQRQD